MPLDGAAISLTTIVAAALVLVVLERFFPYNAGQAVLRKGFFVDLIGYGLVQSWVLGLTIDALIRWMIAGPFQAVHRASWVGGWSLWAQVLFFFVTHDFYIYAFHRLQHRSRLLWRTHEAHHSVGDVDWLAGTRSHAFEILINQTIEFAPIAILGAAPEVALIKATIDAVWGMYIHSNIGVRSGRLQYLLNGPEMHRWHHAREMALNNANFSTKLAVWDWMFGTAFLPPERAAVYGLHGDDSYPDGYFAQQWALFRRVAREQRPNVRLPAPGEGGSRAPAKGLVFSSAVETHNPNSAT